MRHLHRFRRVHEVSDDSGWCSSTPRSPCCQRACCEALREQSCHDAIVGYWKAHLPEKAGLIPPPLLDVAVQGIVADVGASTIKEGRVHLPLPYVKVVAHVISPPLHSTMPVLSCAFLSRP